MSSTLARTAHGAGWVVAWRMTTRLLGLVSTLVLARLLTPADFGLVALAYACRSTLDACTNAGVEQQIIRSPNPTRELYDTAFTLNMARCLAIAALLALGAALAVFFGDPRLETVLLVLALLPAIGGFTNIGVVDFHRDLAFRREFQMMILPRLVTFVTSLGAALVFRSYWALVLSMVTGSICSVTMSYLMHPFRPRLSLVAWRELAGFSFWIWALSVASVVRDRADSFFVGRLLGPWSLGVYSLGSEIATLPASEVVGPICRASFPGLAASQREGGDAATRDAFFRIIALTALVMLPAGVGVAMVAAPVVFLAVGPAWNEAVPLVAVLGIAGVALPFGNISQVLLTAQGRMRLLFGVYLVAALARLGLMAAFIPWLGLPGAALALGLGFLLDAVMMVYFATRMLRVRPGAVLLPCWRPAAASAAMALVLWATGLGWAPVPTDAAAAIRALAAGVGCGVVVYAAIAAALWLACNRPAGAESDLLRVIGQATQRLRRVRSAAVPAGPAE
ncbi:oligosaccharide flippase family protein [Siccirubricoccus deserti]